MTTALKLCMILACATELTVSAAIREAAPRRVTVTAYCCCPICCGKWACGENLRREALHSGVSVAGPRRYPLGTKVWIEGLGARVIEDRTARRYDDRFDLYFANHAQAVAFGERKLKVILLETPPHKTQSTKPASLPVRATPRQKIQGEVAGGSGAIDVHRKRS